MHRKTDPQSAPLNCPRLSETRIGAVPPSVMLERTGTGPRDAAQHSSGGLPDRILIKGRGGTDFRPGFSTPSLTFGAE